MSASEPRRIAVLGATGSVGRAALELLDAGHRDSHRIFALSAHRDARALAELCARFKPEYAALSGARDAGELRRLLGAGGTRALCGPEALEQIAADPRCDEVVAGIVGAAGLASTLAAARAGKRVLLANKEALVMAGELVMGAARRGGATLLPLDSEHSAVWQCLGGRELKAPDTVRAVVLTASGGALLDWPLERLGAATPAEACAHPNWDMGAKISVDSATMMNKGLEIMEARWLFELELERIEVVVHPQSIVHALVAHQDGSVVAQLAEPDMRLPLARALAWPEAAARGAPPLDLTRAPSLAFMPVEARRFPCFALARAAAARPAAAVALNAANEVAVRAFLDGALGFDRIAAVVERVLEAFASAPPPAGLDETLALDRHARAAAQEAAARAARGSALL